MRNHFANENCCKPLQVRTTESCVGPRAYWRWRPTWTPSKSRVATRRRPRRRATRRWATRRRPRRRATRRWATRRGSRRWATRRRPRRRATRRWATRRGSRRWATRRRPEAGNPAGTPPLTPHPGGGRRTARWRTARGWTGRTARATAPQPYSPGGPGGQPGGGPGGQIGGGSGQPASAGLGQPVAAAPQPCSWKARMDIHRRLNDRDNHRERNSRNQGDKTEFDGTCRPRGCSVPGTLSYFRSVTSQQRGN